MVCPLTGCFSKTWYLVTYDGCAEFRITHDPEEARWWSDGITSARRKGCKLFKEAYEHGEIHCSHITGDMPHPFVPHPNFDTTNLTAGSVLEPTGDYSCNAIVNDNPEYNQTK